MDPIAYLKGEWQVISQAPLAFIIGGIIVATLTYAWVRHSFSDRLATAGDRLKLKDEQLGDYREKLHGASPEEARQRLDRLEALVAQISPRRLTEEQERSLRSTLNGCRGLIEILSDQGSADSQTFAADFKQIFRELQWDIQEYSVFSPGATSATGLILLVDNITTLRGAEAQVRNALQAAGIQFGIHAGLDGPTNTRSRRYPDVGLLITSRMI